MHPHRRLGSQAENASLGVPLDGSLREQLEACFQADLSDLRIHYDAAGAAVANTFDAASVCWQQRVFFDRGCYRPDADWGRWIIAHEAVHFLQQRGSEVSESSAPEQDVDELEREADLGARAFLAGRLFRVRSRPSVPEALCLAPILWLLLAAAGITTVAAGRSYLEPSSNYKQRQRAKGTFAYETAWGYVPFVGSYSQMMHGRTEMDTFWGTSFFIMDCTVVLGVVRAAVCGLRAVAGRGLGAAAAGEGTELQARALAQAEASGFKVVAKEAAQETLNTAVREGSSRYTVVAVTEGIANHSAVYIFDRATNAAYKLHGSVFEWLLNETFRDKFAEKIAQEGPEAAQRWLASTIAENANRMSVYHMKQRAAQSGVAYLNDLMTSNRLTQMLTAGVQHGCAGTQAMILERLKLAGARNIGKTGSSFVDNLTLDLTRTFPILLDSSRAALTSGAHLIVEGTGRRQAVGTLAQVLPGAAALPATQMVAESASDALVEGRNPFRESNTIRRGVFVEDKINSILHRFGGGPPLVIGNGVTFQSIGPEIPINPFTAPPPPPPRAPARPAQPHWVPVRGMIPTDRQHHS